MTNLNFIVLGAAKAGTSWVHSCLEEHPDIFVPREKELHFFSYPENYYQGIDWYESFFQTRDCQSAVGEVCPSYLTEDSVAQKIYDYNPNIKLIAILRSPIERAYSHYCMDLRSGLLSEDIDRELTPQNKRVRQGLYYYHIQKFLKLFEAEHIKVLLYEDLKQNPAAFIQEIYAFLKVDSNFSPSILHKRQNQRKALPKFNTLYSYLKSVEKWINENSSYGRGIVNYMRRYGYFDSFHKLNEGQTYPQLSTQAEQKLAEFYQSDLHLLEQMLERDLSFWLKPYLAQNSTRQPESIKSST